MEEDARHLGEIKIILPQPVSKEYKLPIFAWEIGPAFADLSGLASWVVSDNNSKEAP
jgi:hypothetical protein